MNLGRVRPPIRWLASPWLIALGLACGAAVPRVARPDIAEYKLDEATVVLNARAIVQDHILPLHGQASSVPGLYHSPILFYLVAPFLAFQSDPRAAVVGIGLINALSVGLAYVVVARSFGRRVALAAALLFASGSWALIFSRKIWSIDLLAPCAVIALWGILRAIDPTTRTPGLGRSWIALAVMVALNYSSWPLVVVVGLAQACLPRTRRGAALAWSALGASVLVIPLIALTPDLIHAFSHLAAPASRHLTFDLQPLDFVVQLASPTGFLVLAGPAPDFAGQVPALGWLAPAMEVLLFGGAAVAAIRALAPLAAAARRRQLGSSDGAVAARLPRPPASSITPETVILGWWLTPAILSLARVEPVYIHHFADTFPSQFVLMALGVDWLAGFASAGLSGLTSTAGLVSFTKLSRSGSDGRESSALKGGSRNAGLKPRGLSGPSALLLALKPELPRPIPGYLVEARQSRARASALANVLGPSLAGVAAAVQLVAFAQYLPYVQDHPLDTSFGVPLGYDEAAVRSAVAASPGRPAVALGSGGDTIGVDEGPTVLASVAAPDSIQFADSDKTIVLPSGGETPYLLLRAPGDDLDAALAPWRAPGGPVSSGDFDVGADYQLTTASDPGDWLPADWRPVDVPLEDQSVVVGEQMPRQIQPGKPAEVDVAWRVGQPPADPQRQSVFAHLVDDHGQSPTGQDLAPMPSSAWTSGETMVNRFTITPPKNLPPGRYWIEFGRYQRPEIQPVRVVDDGKPGPASVKLGPLAVAPRPRDVPGLNALDARFAGGISLVGWKASTSGSTLNVVLLWRADRAPTGTYTVFVHLIGTNGQIVAQNDSEPRRGAFPTSTWNPGDQVPDRHGLSLRGVKDGAYSLRIGLYGANGRRLSVGKGDSVTVGPVVVGHPASPAPRPTAAPARPTPRPVKPTPTPSHGKRAPVPTAHPH